MDNECKEGICRDIQRLERMIELMRSSSSETHKAIWVAINELKTNDAVQDSKYDQILNNLRNVTTEVKALQEVPRNNWRELVHTIISTLVAVIIGYMAAKVGF